MWHIYSALANTSQGHLSWKAILVDVHLIIPESFFFTKENIIFSISYSSFLAILTVKKQKDGPNKLPLGLFYPGSTELFTQEIALELFYS